MSFQFNKNSAENTSVLHYFKSRSPFKAVQNKMRLLLIATVATLVGCELANSRGVREDESLCDVPRELDRNIISCLEDNLPQYYVDKARQILECLHHDNLMDLLDAICQRGLIIMPREMLILEPISRLNQRQMSLPRKKDTPPHAMFTAEENYNRFCGLNYQDFGNSEGLHQDIKASNEFSRKTKRAEGTKEEKYTIELAVFFDKYLRDKWLRDVRGGNENYMKDRVLSFISEMEKFYNHPTLETNIDIVVVKVEMVLDPLVTPNENMQVGYKSHLDSFRRWQSQHYPHNWDHAMLITGLENCGESEGVINCNYWVAGTSYSRKMCDHDFSVSFIDGSVSAGVATHELAHNLGVGHDEDLNCPTDTSYVMSDAGNSYQWSNCSSVRIRKFLQSEDSACLKIRSNPQTISKSHSPSLFS